jgi:carbon-monoxide dehydrogenase large subunit
VTARPKYVGGAVKRREDKRLLLGRGTYVADIQLNGMVHMAVLRSPLAHARINSIDISAARQHPGVLDVVTFDEIRDLVGPLPCIDLFPDSKQALHTVLADGKVRYVGEPVAAVVADDPYIAEDAVDLIDVDYSPLDPVVDLGSALRDDAPVLYEEFGTNVANTIHHEVGDVDAAFAAADRVFSERFDIHRYGAIPMETRGVIAAAEVGTGRVTLWSSTQFPHLARQFLAGVLSLPESHIRVIAPDVGGGFGAKCEFYSEEVLAPVFTMRLGRPVKWIEDRREHMLSTTQAREQTHDVEAAVNADGTVTGVRVTSYTNNGAAMFTLATTPASIFSAMLRGPYRIPNYRAESHSVLTNKTPLAVYRGAGHPQAAFVMERMMDIIASNLGMDRGELRLRNMLTPDELPSDRGTEIVLAGKVEYDSGDYPRCLQMGLELVGYHEFLDEQAAARHDGRYLGLGICCYVEETAIGPYESAIVRVDSSGKVTVLTGSSPHGQGHVTTFSQLVADEFDIDLEDVTVLHGDTDLIADGVGTFASRSAAIGGAAARLAAGRVRQKAMDLAAHLLEVSPSDLEWREGTAQVIGDPSHAMTLGELAQAATAWNQLPEGFEFNLEATHRHQAPGIAFANATHIAIVEVHPRTGQVTILRYGVVHDCGRVINPIIVDGQVHGGVAQGIGGTLLEEFAYDETGQPLTTSFLDYLLPTASDIPHIETAHLESPTPLNPYGFKGAGEGGAVGSPGAIVNALADALAPLGVTLTSDGPYTPARVLGLIQQASDPAT